MVLPDVYLSLPKELNCLVLFYLVAENVVLAQVTKADVDQRPGVLVLGL